MFRFFTPFLSALIVLTGMLGQAHAAATLPGGSEFTLSFYNWESFFDVNSNNAFDAGDLVYGVLNGDNPEAVNAAYLSGVFLLQVADVSGGIIHYSSVSSTSALAPLEDELESVLTSLFFSDGLVNNSEVMMLFDQTSNVAGASYASQADAISAFSYGLDPLNPSGSHFLTYSMLTSANDYWLGKIATDGASLYSGYYGLSVTEYLGSDPDFLTLLENNTGTGLPDTEHEMIGNTVVKTSSDYKPGTEGKVGVLFQHKSTDPQTMATPEPGTLALLGSGMLALFAARRRRARAAC